MDGPLIVWKSNYLWIKCECFHLVALQIWRLPATEPLFLCWLQLKKFNIKNNLVSFTGQLLWKQASGKDKERSKANVSGADLSEEVSIGAHFAPARLLHWLCRACHTGRKSHRSLCFTKPLFMSWANDLLIDTFLKNFSLTADEILQKFMLKLYSHYFASFCSKCGCMIRMLDWTAVMWHMCLGFTRFLMRSLVSKKLLLSHNVYHVKRLNV